MSSARPALTVIVPTVGRETLEALVASIRCQVGPEVCEVLLVGDTHSGSAHGLRRVPELARAESCRYLPHDGGLHAWGHPQRTYGQSVARGRWLLFSQDDNAYVRGAFEGILGRLARTTHPVLFRVDTWQAGLIWRTPEVLLGNVDADMIAVPNNAHTLLPAWETDYIADWRYIAQLDRAYGVDWSELCIARGRPHERPAAPGLALEAAP